MRTKLKENKWLHLSPRVAALVLIVFDKSLLKIAKMHSYILKEKDLTLAEEEGEKTVKFLDRVKITTQETFWQRMYEEKEATQERIAC